MSCVIHWPHWKAQSVRCRSLGTLPFWAWMTLLIVRGLARCGVGDDGVAVVVGELVAVAEADLLGLGRPLGRDCATLLSVPSMVRHSTPVRSIDGTRRSSICSVRSRVDRRLY